MTISSSSLLSYIIWAPTLSPFINSRFCSLQPMREWPTTGAKGIRRTHPIEEDALDASLHSSPTGVIFIIITKKNSSPLGFYCFTNCSVIFSICRTSFAESLIASFHMWSILATFLFILIVVRWIITNR